MVNSKTPELQTAPPVEIPVKIIDGLPPTLHRFGSFTDNLLGGGGFGNVFSIKDPSDGVKYALKCVRIPHGIRAGVAQEVNILMKLLEHENIVEIKGAWPETIEDSDFYWKFVGHGGSRGSSQFFDDNNCKNEYDDDTNSAERTLAPFQYETGTEMDVMFIKMELCDKSLEDWMKHDEIVGSVMSLDEVEDIFQQLLSGLEYLHELRVVHNDIRPANILFKGKTLKLADFGLSFLDRKNREIQNLIKFTTSQVPETLKELIKYRNSPYHTAELCFYKNAFKWISHKSDVFSVGAIIFRLLSSSEDKSDVWHLLDGDEKLGLLFRKLSHQNPGSLELLRVLQKMVSFSPKDRPEVTPSNIDLAKFMLRKSDQHPPLRTLLPEVNGQLKIVRRAEWGARPPTINPHPLSFPSELVIIIHSVSGEGYCSSDKSCELVMRQLQDAHMDDNGWIDIAYQFVIGGNGQVYEGRGWNTIGAHTAKYNKNSVGICLMGDFRLHLPPKTQLETTQKLIQFGVEKGHVIPSFELYGQRDLRKGFDSPGDYLYQEICGWPNKSQTKYPFVLVFSNNFYPSWDAESLFKINPQVGILLHFCRETDV